MKNFSISLIICLLAVMSLNMGAIAAPKPAHLKHARKHLKRNDGSPLLFWTNNCTYGAIEIFVNDVFQGEITKCYGSVPECASDGCVTVMIYGDNNIWTAQTKDGRRKWSSKKVQLQPKDCNSECLL
jgi:hypothetical protein